MRYMKSNYSRLLYILLFSITLLTPIQTNIPTISPLTMQAFVRGPTVNLLYNTSVVIMWTTDSATTSIVHYGTNPTSLTSIATNSSFTKQHRVELTNLTPNTKYYYQAGNGSVWSDIHEFVTAPTGDAPFTFLVYGDHRPASGATAPAELEQLIDLMIPHQPRFVISLGDHILEKSSAAWESYASQTDRIHGNSCYWVTMGNHDQPDTKVMAKWFEWPNETIRNYYSFNYGNCHFIVLDGYTSTSNVLDDVQLNWLKEDLSTTTAKHRFLIIHQPFYATGSHLGHSFDENIEHRDMLWQLFENHSIEAVFAGHEHYYYRLQVGTIPHIISGGGGAPLASAKEFDIYPVEVYKREYHFIRVDVAGDTVNYTVYNIDNQVIDHFSTFSVLSSRPSASNIHHSPTHPQNTSQVIITSTVHYNETLTTVSCNYRLINASTYTRVDMALVPSSGNEFQANLGTFADQQQFYYFIEVNDTAGANYRSFLKRFRVDMLPPTIIKLEPSNESVVSGMTYIVVTTEDGMGISFVEFYVDGLLQANKTYHGLRCVVPWAWDTSNFSNDVHNITVVVHDVGNNCAAFSILLSVNNEITTSLPVELLFFIIGGCLIIVLIIAIILIRNRVRSPQAPE